MNIPILELVEDGIKCRVPTALIGRTFSLINIGVCNFRCVYCCKGGGLPREGLNLPGAEYFEIHEIENFIKEQVTKGNAIKISGGEPTIFINITMRLIKYARNLGAYVSCDTSGYDPEKTLVLAKQVNQLAIDLKGASRYAKQISGVGLKLSWKNPIISIKRTANLVETLEIRTPVFSFTSINDLLELSEYIPDNAYWVLRRFIDEWTINKRGVIISYPNWIESPIIDKMENLIRRLVEKVPRLKERIVILQDNPRLSRGILFQDAITK